MDPELEGLFGDCCEDGRLSNDSRLQFAGWATIFVQNTVFVFLNKSSLKLNVCWWEVNCSSCLLVHYHVFLGWFFVSVSFLRVNLHKIPPRKNTHVWSARGGLKLIGGSGCWGWSRPEFWRKAWNLNILQGIDKDN